MAISPCPKRSHAAGKGLTISVKTFVLPRLTEADPYAYVFTINAPEPFQYLHIQMSGCEGEGPNEVPVTFSVAPLLQNSADGIDFSGSETEEEGERTITREWSFHGTE